VERIGPYDVVQELARGGMGAVYRARGPDGADVAVKTLIVGRSALPAQRERFRLEAAALGRVRHPHVVALRDVGEQDRAPYLVLEFVPGESLGERLRRSGRLDPDDAAALVAKLARAAEAAHAVHVVHRDIKPDNVLLDRRGEPYLTDFGLARDLDPALSDPQLSKSGVFLGTPGYWAPEQARGERDRVGPAADVYGLGATLYACLTGRPPFEGDSVMEFLRLAAEVAPRPPSRRAPGVDARLDAICLRALAKAPEDRHPSAAALADALAAWLAGQGRRSRRSAVVAAGIVAAAGLVAGAISLGAARPGVEPTASPDRPPPAEPTPAEPTPAEATPAEPTPASLYARGQAHVRAGRRDAAWDLAAAALERAPDRAEALALRAGLRVGRDDLEGALRDLERAVELAPDDMMSVALRGLTSARLGRLGPAREDFLDARRALGSRTRPVERLAHELERRAAGLGGDPPEAARRAYAAGVDHAEADRAREALAAFDRAVALAPGWAPAWNKRALYRRTTGDVAGAREDYARALALDPALGAAHLNRGALRQTLGDRPGAARDFEAAVEHAPTDPLAWSNRATVRLWAGDVEASEADARRALTLDRHAPHAYMVLSILYARTGRPEQQLATAERYVGLEPARADAWVARGHARAANGDLRGALADYDEALERDSDDRSALLGRAKSALDLEDWPLAVPALERALAALGPGDPMRARVERDLAQARAALGR